MSVLKMVGGPRDGEELNMPDEMIGQSVTFRDVLIPSGDLNDEEFALAIKRSLIEYAAVRDDDGELYLRYVEK